MFECGPSVLVVPEMGGHRTVTVLFSDLVASTELLADIGDAAFDELRRRLFGALRGAVSRHRGAEVKNLGDGLMVSFASVVDAVDCAVDSQREMRRAGRPAGLRIGLAVGEAMVDGDDYFGTPVVEAARLCAAACGGQILATDVVRLLAADRARWFVPLGALTLKGLPDPVAAVEVLWEEPAGDVPLPAALTVHRDAPFAGREVELAALAKAWAEAIGSSSRRVALVAGEPGIGKTRLAEMFAGAACDEGIVLFGRCDEDFGVPYQPLAEALSAYVSSVPAADLAGQLGPLGGDLARLVPRLAERVPGLEEPLQADPETARYRLFESVTEFLTRMSVDRPVLLIVDDLHWAAASTLSMLRHVARHADPARLLVLLTFRDSEAEQSDALRGFLRDLRREPGVERRELAGLHADEVARFMEQAAGHGLETAEADLAVMLHAETEGNPFFIAEILRHLRETGAVRQTDSRWRVTRPLAELGIPEGIRDVISHRLTRISNGALDVMAAGAVIGREFDVPLLAAACASDDELVLDALATKRPAECSVMRSTKHTLTTTGNDSPVLFSP